MFLFLSMYKYIGSDIQTQCSRAVVKNTNMTSCVEIVRPAQTLSAAATQLRRQRHHRCKFIPIIYHSRRPPYLFISVTKLCAICVRLLYTTYIQAYVRFKKILYFYCALPFVVFFFSFTFYDHINPLLCCCYARKSRRYKTRIINILKYENNILIFICWKTEEHATYFVRASIKLANTIIHFNIIILLSIT